MKGNMGSTDRIIRLIIAVMVLILFMTDIISGTLGWVLIALAAIFTLTSMMNFCPLYTIIGINTKKK
jgi:hypothetical protein